MLELFINLLREPEALQERLGAKRVEAVLLVLHAGEE